MRRNIILFLIAGVFTLVLSILAFSQRLQRSEWKKETTPLPAETQKILCAAFKLNLESVLCDTGKHVYGPDFLPILKDTFRPFKVYGIKSSESATYDEVTRKIGRFEYECESVTTQSDGLSYFVCYYDFRGDRKFIIAIVYTYPEKAVMLITTTSRYGD